MTKLKSSFQDFIKNLEISAKLRQQDYLKNSNAQPDVNFFHLEFLGELGELFMEVGLLRAEDSGLEPLISEIGDYFICLVNLKNSIKSLTNIELDLFYETPFFDSDSPDLNFEPELVTALMSANYVKKLFRLHSGITGNSTSDSSKSLASAIEVHLAEITTIVTHIAKSYNIDLESAIREKFNKTSDKIGSSIKI